MADTPRAYVPLRPASGFAVFGLGTGTRPHRAGKGPAAGAPDPFRGMEEDEQAAETRQARDRTDA
ncbi:MAG TPA: hypothetical protein VMM55_00750 [Thermohalobaculum sp.]|nr:hypothetical protein [Thermohalobaculum sp.]